MKMAYPDISGKSHPCPKCGGFRVQMEKVCWAAILNPMAGRIGLDESTYHKFYCKDCGYETTMLREEDFNKILNDWKETPISEILAKVPRR
jgi:predicted RNA-binding Zn-ribbon protein involved in translation (DUF1610 family)